MTRAHNKQKQIICSIDIPPDALNLTGETSKGLRVVTSSPSFSSCQSLCKPPEPTLAEMKWILKSGNITVQFKIMQKVSWIVSNHIWGKKYCWFFHYCMDQMLLMINYHGRHTHKHTHTHTHTPVQQGETCKNEKQNLVYKSGSWGVFSYLAGGGGKWMLGPFLVGVVPPLPAMTMVLSHILKTLITKLKLTPYFATLFDKSLNNIMQ